jgi:hypothetical protein
METKQIKAKINKMYNYCEHYFEQHPKLSSFFLRIVQVLFVIVAIAAGVIFIVYLFVGCAIWFALNTIELCLIPAYFVMWLFVGKFPIFKATDYIMTKMGHQRFIYG